MTASEAVLLLRSPRTIRQRCAAILEAGLSSQLRHFRVDLERLPAAARCVAEVTRKRYPSLRVPPHSRFAHFDAGGVPRCAQLERELASLSSHERARRLIDLVVVSVLLDAGAGATWRYVEPETGMRLGRSEGLAVASLQFAKQGGFASNGEPYRVDAAGLLAIDAAALERAFQVSVDNPLVGVAGRVHLLGALGHALRARSDVFGSEARSGGLLDRLFASAEQGAIPASLLLAQVLDGFGSIWPGRLELDGVPLGDVWRHAAAGGEGATQGLVPLHKLSQWLCYSLLQPLAAAGLQVRELDELTGLAEYRNGGLFLDSGVLTATDPTQFTHTHAVGSELVVEWRALTVALLDRIAPLVRLELGVDAAQLPLAAVLEGGTWAAGRELAAAARPDAVAPLRIDSDGTVF